MHLSGSLIISVSWTSPNTRDVAGCRTKPLATVTRSVSDISRCKPENTIKRAWGLAAYGWPRAVDASCYDGHATTTAGRGRPLELNVNAATSDIMPRGWAPRRTRRLYPRLDARRAVCWQTDPFVDFDPRTSPDRAGFRGV